MRHAYAIPLTALLLAGPAAHAAHAQSKPAAGLPASQPTSRQPAAQQSAAQPKALGSTRAPARHTQVLYAAGLLTIHAENSSLNGILREISRSTGMQVTGGVVDERVYGNYGPADTGTILAALLSGTGSNMLLEESNADRPLTLVLTPRQGGPTPPSPANVIPDADEDRDHADLPPQQTRPTPVTGQIPVTPANSTPTTIVPTPSTAPADTATTSPASNTTDQQSPNGVKTPQQIYDQLMKLRSQQAPAQPQPTPPQP